MLVKNWKRIALQSYSMWAIYLGLALLILPEVWFWSKGYQLISPYLTGYGGIALLVLGAIGRLWDQKIDRNSTQCSPVTVAAFLAIAVPFVGQWEGLRNNAYLDVVGVPTICYGHTTGVQLGDFMTDTECEELFKHELLEYRDNLHEFFTHETIENRLTPERDVAYVSLAYNVGVSGAGKSTATRRLNAGNIAGGCDAITWWNKAGGKVWRGLVRRRGAEYDLCMKGLV